jgi:hypothetical protein
MLEREHEEEARLLAAIAAGDCVALRILSHVAPPRRR